MAFIMMLTALCILSDITEHTHFCFKDDNIFLVFEITYPEGITITKILEVVGRKYGGALGSRVYNSFLRFILQVGIDVCGVAAVVCSIIASSEDNLGYLELTEREALRAKKPENVLFLQGGTRLGSLLVAQGSTLKTLTRPSSMLESFDMLYDLTERIVDADGETVQGATQSQRFFVCSGEPDHGTL